MILSCVPSNLLPGKCYILWHCGKPTGGTGKTELNLCWIKHNQALFESSTSIQSTIWSKNSRQARTPRRTTCHLRNQCTAEISSHLAGEPGAESWATLSPVEVCHFEQWVKREWPPAPRDLKELYISLVTYFAALGILASCPNLKSPRIVALDPQQYRYHPIPFNLRRVIDQGEHPTTVHSICWLRLQVFAQKRPQRPISLGLIPSNMKLMDSMPSRPCEGLM